MNNASTFFDTFLIKRKTTLNLGKNRVFFGIIYAGYALIHPTKNIGNVVTDVSDAHIP